MGDRRGDRSDSRLGADASVTQWRSDIAGKVLARTSDEAGLNRMRQLASIAMSQTLVPEGENLN